MTELSPHDAGDIGHRTKRPGMALSAQRINTLLDGAKWRTARRRIYEELRMHKDFFNIDFKWDMHEARSRTHAMTMHFAKFNLIKTSDIDKEPEKFLGYANGLLLLDGSVATRMVVHQQLFGGSVIDLGTERHRAKYLADIESVKIFGGFALTEAANGSDARSIQTTATFDPATDELVINTPNDHARKWWIGNIFSYGTHAVVFARLIVDGKDHGLSGMVVQMRDPKTGKFFDTIEVKDLGAKGGWKGVANSAIRFKNHRIPRDELLDRFGSLDAKGVYKSDMSPGARFGATLGALVFGRLVYVFAPHVVLQQAVAIGARYACRRKQFGGYLMAYPTHHRAIMSYIAHTYAIWSMRRPLIKMYGEARKDADKMSAFHGMISALKAHSTEFTYQTVSHLRLMCGGHGYLDLNRLTVLRNDADVLQTAEGDVTVLRLQAARWILTKDDAINNDLEIPSAPINEVPADVQPILDLVTKIRADDARAYMGELGLPLGEAFVKSTHLLAPIGQAYALALSHHYFTLALKKLAKSLLPLIEPLHRLHALYMLDLSAEALLLNNVVTPDFCKAVTAELTKVAEQTSWDATLYVDAFDIPDYVMQSPIGRSDGDYVKNMLAKL